MNNKRFLKLLLTPFCLPPLTIKLGDIVGYCCRKRGKTLALVGHASVTTGGHFAPCITPVDLLCRLVRWRTNVFLRMSLMWTYLSHVTNSSVLISTSETMISIINKRPWSQQQIDTYVMVIRGLLQARAVIWAFPCLKIDQNFCPFLALPVRCEPWIGFTRLRGSIFGLRRALDCQKLHKAEKSVALQKILLLELAACIPWGACNGQGIPWIIVRPII